VTNGIHLLKKKKTTTELCPSPALTVHVPDACRCKCQIAVVFQALHRELLQNYIHGDSTF